MLRPLNWDDNILLLENPRYRGLGWGNIAWMLTTFEGGLYHPLTWLTFGMDHLMWGMEPSGYHLTNILLHASNAVLFLLICIALMTRARSKPGANRGSTALAAALAALLFGIHPLRVESVAWIIERKDVLSGFFYLAAVLFYLKAHAGRSPIRRWQAASLFSYLLSLLSKGVGVSLPMTLLILDLYPLRRLPSDPRSWLSKSFRAVWLEKLPYLLLAAAAGATGYLALTSHGFIRSLEHHGLVARAGLAAFSLAFHLWKTLWPVGLAPHYEIPHQPDLLDWPFVLSALIVMAITIVLLARRRAWPAALAVWAFYAVTLAPMSGLFQFGSQSAADHFTYLACLGWALLAGAGALHLWEAAPPPIGKVAAAAALAVTITLGSLTWGQIKIWRDSERLWTHTLSLRPKNSVAHVQMGSLLEQHGKVKRALRHYREAVRVNPGNIMGFIHLGMVLHRQGHLSAAVQAYHRALKVGPENRMAHHLLARTLTAQGKTEEAKEHYRKGLADGGKLRIPSLDATTRTRRRIDLGDVIERRRAAARAAPEDPATRYVLAMTLSAQGDWDEAIEHYREVLRLAPQHADAHNGLGSALATQGHVEEALPHFKMAVQLSPEDAIAVCNLANAYLLLESYDLAVVYYQSALQISPDYAKARENLEVAQVRLERSRSRDPDSPHLLE